MQLQTRSVKTTLEIRDRRRLAFYAAVYNSPTTLTDYAEPYKRRMRFTEVVEQGAFSHALASDTEVIACVDHDVGRTFARRSDRSLLLQSDDYGLFCSAWLPKDELGDTILSDIQAGKLTGCSFKFRPHVNGAEWIDGATPVCKLRSLMLADVCLTGSPAYASTDLMHIRSRPTTDTTIAIYDYIKIKMRQLNKTRNNRRTI